jgi:hypothetical protein
MSDHPLADPLNESVLTYTEGSAEWARGQIVDLRAEREQLEAALRWMATEWAKYAEDTSAPNPELVRGGVEQALDAAKRQLTSGGDQREQQP